MENVLQCYCAGPWFTRNQDIVQTELENYLRTLEGSIKSYFPRHDGIKLESNQFHDVKKRESVFRDNLSHIEIADLVIANLDGRDGYQDTGTCYEVGYAMALGIPVIGYQKDNDGKINYHMQAISPKFYATCTGLTDLGLTLSRFPTVIKDNIVYPENNVGTKILFVSPDDSQKSIDSATEVANTILESYGVEFRWVDKLSSSQLSIHIDKVLQNIKFLIAVIDDRNPVVSWMMGQCYARRIPIVSYTNNDYGVNLMLALSILQHVKGLEDLKILLQKIKRVGIESIDTYDNSKIRVF